VAALAEFMNRNNLNVIDISGYFQYHTYFLAKYKTGFKRLFGYPAELVRRIELILSKIGMDNRSIIGIHVRQGDFLITRNQHRYFWVNSTDALVKSVGDIIGSTFHAPIIYIASDDVERVGADFASRQIPFVTYKSIIEDAPDIDPMVIDHIMLILSSALLISNSSFSFTAAMLNDNASIFLRPNPDADNFIPFDPWNSDVLLEKQGYV
jgi:hypothetical protein